MNDGDFLSNPALVFCVLAVFVWLAARPLVRADPRIAGWIAAGFVVRVLGSLANHFFFSSVYGTLGDAEGYLAGSRVASAAISNGDYWPDVSSVLLGSESTANVARILGWWDFVVGSSEFSAYIAFAFIGYLGSIAFIRALQLSATPESARRYAIAIAFLPSIAFYPSIVGKDALVFAGMGLAALGVAQFSNGSGRSLAAPVLSAGLGLALVWLARPPAAAAIGMALLLVSPHRGGSDSSRTTRWLLVACLLPGAVYLFIGQFNLVARDEVVDLFQRQTQVTERGGSSFSNDSASSPLSFLLNYVVILFRPWPHETSNISQLIASLEGLAILGFVANQLRSWRSVAARIKASPLLTYFLLSTLTSALLLSSLSNFGLLVRQRVHVWPLLLGLLIARTRRHREPATERIGADRIGTSA